MWHYFVPCPLSAIIPVVSVQRAAFTMFVAHETVFNLGSHSGDTAVGFTSLDYEPRCGPLSAVIPVVSVQRAAFTMLLMKTVFNLGSHSGDAALRKVHSGEGGNPA